MDLRQLRSFREIAETGSLSRAADRLRIAQPALSRQIRLLEAEAGLPLFTRHGRGMALTEARKRGFQNAIMLDVIGNVAEFATSNIFIAKDGVVRTPVPNGCFLNGITRQRVIALLRNDGVTVEECTLTPKDLFEADEVFSTGNHAKCVPVTKVEDRSFAAGPIFQRARALYWEYAFR